MNPQAGRVALAEWALPGILLLVFGGLAVGLLAIVERQRPPEARAAELAYLPKGEYLKVAVLGYHQIVADLIWLKAVQHFGERQQTKKGYKWAYHAVDVVTDLDPKFSFAYRAAGTILGVWAGLVQESIAILSKGMRHNPEVWELPFYLGYDYFFELHDPKSAALYFQKAAELPGSPAYLPKLAARMTVEAGDPVAALEFLERLYRQMQDEQLRKGLERRMREVAVERDIRSLEEAVHQYKVRHKKNPGKLEDLVKAGIIPQVPIEPLGGTYQLNAKDGTVISTGSAERLRVHRR